MLCGTVLASTQVFNLSSLKTRSVVSFVVVDFEAAPKTSKDTQVMSRTAVEIMLNARERELLQKIYAKRSVPEFMKNRVQVVLAATTGLQNQEIAQKYGLEVHMIGMWRNRFAQHHRTWTQSDPTLRPAMNEALFLGWLADRKGRGRKETITQEQRTKIAALSLESPEQSDLPVTHWTSELLAAEAVRRGIIETISTSSVKKILKKTTCRPTTVGTGSTPR
jgi:hypothetical protein